MISKTVLHYKIIKELGRGGIGVVYLTKDIKVDRRVISSKSCMNM
jgi:serine/threonine protein kinase